MSEQKKISMQTPLRTAVIGCGYLGRYHAEKYHQLETSHLVAVVDSNPEVGRLLAEKWGVDFYSDYRAIYDKVDAISLVTPTSTHYQIGKAFLSQGIHVLMEKPITVNVAQADELIALAEHHQCVLQVGHLERFNAAILGLDALLTQPTFIESHRLAPFKLRATDVNVVLDLMIHDIDIILNLVREPLIAIAANGATVLSDAIDIANARLTFANGCVANVTASRVSLKTERKMRIFQNDAYISVDFQNRILSHHFKSTQANTEGIPKIESNETVYENNDALKTEIEAFLNSIEHSRPPLVSGHDGRRALETAIEITRLLNNPHTEEAVL